MIPDITFKEFVNNLFDYTKTPLENRNWITATKDNLFTYAYTWAEIEDYINRWLKMVPIDKLDIEVNTAFDIMDKIVDNWYQINFNNPTGRCGYDDDIDPYISKLDWEEFYLHTKVREFIWKQAKGLREIEEARLAKERAEEARLAKERAEKARLAKEQTEKKKEETKFENYLSCPEEQKKALMEKLRQLFKTAVPIKAYFILQALHSLEYFDLAERGRSKKIKAINNEFGTMYSDENINKPYREWEKNNRKRDDDQEITKIIKLLKSN